MKNNICVSGNVNEHSTGARTKIKLVFGTSMHIIFHESEFSCTAIDTWTWQYFDVKKMLGGWIYLDKNGSSCA